MALYEYRCRTCESTFEARRPMAEANDPITCPDGHPAVRLLSVFASVGGASPSPAASAPAPMPMAGGCCGGGCHTH